MCLLEQDFSQNISEAKRNRRRRIEVDELTGGIHEACRFGDRRSCSHSVHCWTCQLQRVVSRPAACERASQSLEVYSEPNLSSVASRRCIINNPSALHS